jgi:hypothetical protein
VAPNVEEEVPMRGISLLIAGTILASCTTAPPAPQTPTPRGMADYQRAVAGKVAQAPLECLPNYSSRDDMRPIDGRTIAFKVDSARSYIVHLTPGCELIRSGTYTLVSRQVGGMGLCRGDIQTVIDPHIGITVGSCAVADIVPYYRR